MKPELTPDELLLYWSDELSAEARAGVAARLAEDASAREYLAELDTLQSDVASLGASESDRKWADDFVGQTSLPTDPVKVLAEIIPFWQLPSVQIAAAGIAVMFGLVWMVSSPPQGASPESMARAAPSPTVEVTPVVVSASPNEGDRTINSAAGDSRLSDRLFRSTSRLSVRDRVQSMRERRSSIFSRGSNDEGSS